MKVLGTALLAFGIYLGYFIVIKPYLWRKKYQKYSNVLVGDKFIPVVGDSIKELNSIKANKVHYAHYEEDAHITKKYDLMAKLEGSVPVILVLSSRATQEFLQLQKRSLIDRYNTYRGLQVMLGKSITPRATTPDVVQRRKNMTQWLGLNASSQFISRMIQLCRETQKAISKQNQDVDIMHHCNIWTFNVLTQIIFGEDSSKVINNFYPYINSDGSVEEINLREMLIRVAKVYLDQHFSPFTNMFPILSKYKFINPYKRDYKNLQTFEKAIHHIMTTSKDTSSVGSKFFANKECTDEEKVGDIILILVGGAETTAHAIVSSLYLLQKNPEALQKLKDELTNNGLTRNEDFEKNCTLENIQNCTYLNCVIKETLRRENPASVTFEYKVKQDIQICGVPIQKNEDIRLDIMASKFDDDKWLNPHNFAPERHDPESEFYQNAKKLGKVADAYTMRPFSLGNRNCPGQSLAILELKVFLAYFVTHINWEFSQEDLQHEGIGFAMGTQFEAKIKVSSKREILVKSCYIQKYP
ncbi:unnamed protein product [Moneuplotes crassus]|uniref:Cytochrome P450 n=1 Tax=Euplotes crassus TaxID=5936 RepID=A0AAD1Y870_EUPCR|nr:unnamed protein product [Moneuplotes crassus]